MKKACLMLISSIVLFSLTVNLAKADLVITVLDSVCSPINGAWVRTATDMGFTNPVCTAYTNASGMTICPSNNLPYCPYTYWVKVCLDGSTCNVMKYKGPADVNEICTGILTIRDIEKCSSGYCVDGYCCNSACSGNCDKCNVQDSEGICTNVNSECTGNCDYCNGNCVADNNQCTGNCDYCTGSGTTFNCAPNENECEAFKCSDCNGGGTSYSCTYDQTEDSDCDFFDLIGIATCDWIPDNYHPTWDFRNAFDSQCAGLDQCSQEDSSITHTCNQPTCGAECDQTSDCSNKCIGKKWYSTYSCNLGTCGCVLNNPICSVGKCGAVCDGPEDCGGLTCNSDCTCASDTNPPEITVNSPHSVYYSKSINVNLTLNEPISWIGYSLDSQANKTLWNVTRPDNTYSTYITVSSGNHNIIFYANDTSGNMGESDKVYFTVKSRGGGGCGSPTSMTACRLY